jgi:hypothetical protein
MATTNESGHRGAVAEKICALRQKTRAANGSPNVDLTQHHDTRRRST